MAYGQCTVTSLHSINNLRRPTAVPIRQPADTGLILRLLRQSLKLKNPHSQLKQVHHPVDECQRMGRIARDIEINVMGIYELSLDCRAAGK